MATPLDRTSETSNEPSRDTAPDVRARIGHREPPPGFVVDTVHATRTIITREDFTARLSQIGFRDGQPLSTPVTTVGGRSDHGVYALRDGPANAPSTHVLWKRVARGGLWGRLFGDRHWRVDRFVDELWLIERARAADVQVPAILGLAFTRPSATSRTFRVEALVEVVGGARDVAAALTDVTLPAGTRRRLCIAIGRELRCFHDAGLLHGDLNVKNILWRLRDDGAIDVWFIDLDPGLGFARVGRNPEGNLMRLWRSYMKGITGHRWRASASAAQRVVIAYFGDDRAGRRRFWRRALRRRIGYRIRHGLFGRAQG